MSRFEEIAGSGRLRVTTRKDVVKANTEVLPARAAPLSFNDWVGMFNYGGVGYPYYQQSMTLGQDIEPPDPSFAGYVRSAYKSNGIVFACMAARALLFSEARFQFRQLRSGRPGDLFGTTDLAPLEVPWPNGTTGDLLMRAITDVDLAGNFYAVRRGSTIKRMRPDWVTIVLGSDLDPDDPGLALDCEVLGYIYRPGGYAPIDKSTVLRPEQVAHWASLPDPEARFRGMSWITPVIREIMSDQAATNHSQEYFEKGATQNIAVTLDPSVTGDAFREFVQMFEQRHSDLTDAYRTLFFGGGATITPVGSTMQQAEFKETRGSGETRICMAARVPPIIVGASEGLQSATYSNYGQARRAFADLTMRPLWRQVCGAFASVIDVPERSELWYDDRDIAFLQEDVKDAADIIEAQSRSIRTLSDGGYDPDSAVEAVTSGDLRRLEHSGLLSVQMQSPGSPSPSANGSANGKAETEDAAARGLPPFAEVRAYVEAQHPRDPGGQGGGQWVRKHGPWVDSSGMPTTGEIVPTNPKLKPFRDLSQLHTDTPLGMIGFSTQGDAGADGQYHERVFAVRDSDSETLGYLDVVHHEGTLKIEHVEVPEQYRRQGIASTLLDAVRYVNEGKRVSVAGGFATAEGEAFLKANKVPARSMPIGAGVSPKEITDGD